PAPLDPPGAPSPARRPRHTGNTTERGGPTGSGPGSPGLVRAPVDVGHLAGDVPRPGGGEELQVAAMSPGVPGRPRDVAATSRRRRDRLSEALEAPAPRGPPVGERPRLLRDAVPRLLVHSDRARDRACGRTPPLRSGRAPGLLLSRRRGRCGRWLRRGSGTGPSPPSGRRRGGRGCGARRGCGGPVPRVRPGPCAGPGR